MSDVETPFTPGLMLFYLGFCVANIFQGTQDITTKCIIQCFLIDFEMFKGKQRYVDDRIQEFMNKFGDMIEHEIITRQIEDELPEELAMEFFDEVQIKKKKVNKLS